MVYTTSNVFLETLILAGITHAFVNLGSDHPALLEAIADRAGQDGKDLKIVTCPNEMVALSAAQGYAQVTGKPAAVIVHVDCGTQALAGAIHNVDRNRTPVFIYAGAAPYTLHGELPGSRNEFIFTLQDIPDQSAIVRQYMRHTALIRSGTNVSQVMLRALTFANSEPKGPVYLYAGREAMEEHLDPSSSTAKLSALRSPGGLDEWSPMERSALSPFAILKIGAALLNAKRPLIITSYAGRHPEAVNALVKLSETISIPIYLSCPSVVNVPFSCKNLVGLGYGMGKNEWLEEADCVLVIDSDVPWIPLHTRPKDDCQVYHIDVDPLKQNVNVFHIPAKIRTKADCELACLALTEYIEEQLLNTDTRHYKAREQANREAHERFMEEIKKEEESTSGKGRITVPQALKALREEMPKNTLVLSEAISNYPLVWKHLQIDTPRKMFTSGGSSLGWGLGAAIGAHFGGQVSPNVASDLIVLVVGDGSFLFGVPSSAYWMARRYSTPFLTLVLNNGGWKSPRLSMLGVHPQGVGAGKAARDVHVTFGGEENEPDFGGIAEAAGGAWKAVLEDPKKGNEVIKEAIQVVKGGRSAVVEIRLDKF